MAPEPDNDPTVWDPGPTGQFDVEGPPERFRAFEVVTLLLSHCLALLPVDAAAVLLTDRAGPLRVLAATTEEARLLELLELQDDGGPAQAAHATRQPVLVPDLPLMADRWRVFVGEAVQRGVRSAYAFPMTVHHRSIGALSLFAYEPTELAPEHLRIAEVLATMSTIGIVNQRTADQQDELARQLQRALESRVVIEQAKGVIAAQQGIDLAAAFDRLRTAARSSGRPLPQLAADVVSGRLRRETAYPRLP